jgi:hypothetical protein
VQAAIAVGARTPSSIIANLRERPNMVELCYGIFVLLVSRSQGRRSLICPGNWECQSYEYLPASGGRFSVPGLMNILPKYIFSISAYKKQNPRVGWGGSGSTNGRLIIVFSSDWRMTGLPRIVCTSASSDRFIHACVGFV